MMMLPRASAGTRVISPSKATYERWAPLIIFTLRTRKGTAAKDTWCQFLSLFMSKVSSTSNWMNSIAYFRKTLPTSCGIRDGSGGSTASRAVPRPGGRSLGD